MLKPLIGATYLLRGFKLIIKPGVFPYVIVPMLINITLFAGVLLLSIGQFELLLGWLMPQLPDYLQWLAWLFWLLFVLTTLVVIFFTFSLVANIIAAPFNGLLAEAVERHLTGSAPGSSGGWKQALAEAPQAIGNEIRKLGYFVRIAIPLLILFLIPVLNLVAPLLWFLFSAWMLALEYSDYPLGNRGMYFRQQRPLVRQHGGLAMGFGMATMAATMIPLVNFLVMPVAVAGATAMWVENEKGVR